MENALDHRVQNKKIQESLKDSVISMFPIKSGNKELRVENVVLEDDLSETDFPAQKEVKLNRDT
jgi:hypothetical protein